MDDPWGSPWATADELPTINLPAAPPPATLSSRSNSPRVSISAQASPWQNDDDAWGGWNDARSGTSSPGWGRSPRLKPAMVRERERDVSPGPWVGRKGEDGSVDPLERTERKATLETNDVRSRSNRDEKKDALRPEEAERVSLPDSPVRAASPDIPPPGTALSTENRPEPSRSSSKVQELVHMYEKRSVSPAEPALVSPPPQKLRNVDAEEDEECGDVVGSPVELQTEKVDTDYVVKSLETKSAKAAPGPDGLSEDKDFKTQPREATSTADGWPEDDSPEALVAPSPSRPSTKRPDLTFPLDLSNLDSLFASASPGDIEPEPLPDTIIDDTFTTITERKTWYRISRFGSMRKHNHGNDENYIRMDWLRSAARDKSLRIVRRWMEEDSIAGRVSLGARRKGAAGGSMFNWDSKAEPVDVGELLSKKRGHERDGSKGSKGSIPPPKGAMFGWHERGGSKGSIDSRAAVASPTGATFGWSSQTTSPTGPSFPKPFDLNAPGVSGAGSRPQSLIMPTKSVVGESATLAAQPKTRPASLIMPPPQSMARPSIDQTLAPNGTTSGNDAQTGSKMTQNGPEEDDDDDWGEMVSSPTVTSMNTALPKSVDAPKAGTTVIEAIASPSAANFRWNDAPSPSQATSEQVKPYVSAQASSSALNFGWSENHSTPKASPEQLRAVTETDSNPGVSSFGWEDFEKSPESTGTSQMQPNGEALSWDALKKPPNGVADQDPGPQSPPQPAFDWAKSENSTGVAPAVQTQPDTAGTADFEWDDWEEPTMGAQKQGSTPKSPLEATSSREDSVKPSENSVTTAAAVSYAGNNQLGWYDSPQSQTLPLRTSVDTHQTQAPSTVHSRPTSAAITSPSSPKLPSSSSSPSANPPLKQPQPPKTHARTASQTKKDDVTVAKILNDLPDLSYMLR